MLLYFPKSVVDEASIDDIQDMYEATTRYEKQFGRTLLKAFKYHILSTQSGKDAEADKKMKQQARFIWSYYFPEANKKPKPPTQEEQQAKIDQLLRRG